MMTPLQRYQSDIQKRRIKTDDKQWQAVQHTQRLYSELIIDTEAKKSFLSSLFKQKQVPVRGLYLWGGTGRGKTYLVDCFYECLPDKKKHRVHFHRFMLEIHQQLDSLPKSPNPLDIIASQLAEKMHVLCLDEFHVHDIADAMLLAGLLKAMFKQGITLVATSNISIHNLYKNGLQRERFMYAIELLQKHTEEFDLGDGTDYRFNILGESEHFYVPDDTNTKEMGEDFLLYKFTELAPCQPKNKRSIEINNREIKYISCADDVIWFDFYELCQTNRSAYDYIEIAERFHTVLLSNIQVFNEKDDAAAKRFIHFIDAIYDHNVKLLASAAATPGSLYLGKRMKFAFDRTISRLTEMGTEQYLKLAHNPTGTVRTLR
ncbi:MAG: cell division protein ZapE [Gammaproteobacteria bacterium]|nr:MAG: cell division protein ZapE [Gammaproteobacteria bacterium]